MSFEPRSTLLPINSQCELSQSCLYCRGLGYLRRIEALSVDSFSAALEISNRVIFPCSSIRENNFFALKELIKKQGKNISHVVLNTYFKKNAHLFESTASEPISIVLTNFSEFSEIIKGKAKYYFLITPKNWDLNKWLLIKERDQVSYFFLQNHIAEEQCFSIEEKLKIATAIKRENYKIKIEPPGNHDLIDQRNESHIHWNLRPNYIKQKISLPERKKMISVIIPFYNRTPLLIPVLKFLAKQTLEKRDFEILLVDDGSERKSSEEIQEFLRLFDGPDVKYIYVARHEKINTSFSANRAGPIRNLGARLANSELFLFLDSDIILPSDYLEKVIELHQKVDVVSPKRVYLTEDASRRIQKSYDKIELANIKRMPWQGYLDEFYQNMNWVDTAHPWKYFISFCLSVKAKLFFDSGEFRSNYISFGYEDLDLGFRLIQMTKDIKLIDVNVFHLFHFGRKAEYSLDSDLREFQLAMTSRTFVTQNMPLDADYLLEMTRLKSRKQKLLYQYYKLHWMKNRLRSSF